MAKRDPEEKRKVIFGQDHIFFSLSVIAGSKSTFRVLRLAIFDFNVCSDPWVTPQTTRASIGDGKEYNNSHPRLLVKL